MANGRVLGTLCALGGALVLAACGAQQPAARSAPTAPLEGRLRLAMQTVADMKPVPATLTTRDMADARARISGVLTRLTVKDGDNVRQGQLVAMVRDERIGMETGAYDAQVAAASAEAARAAADLARTQDLYNHGVYAKARLEQVEAAAKVASNQLAAARAQRAASAELGAQGAIYAPAAGRVLAADTPVGSVVMAGQSVARITAGPVVVRLELPEAEASALKLGEVVRLNPRDLNGAASQGVITQIYPAIDNGQIQADVTAPGLPTDLVGARVRAMVQVGERQALLAPRRYIVTRDGVDYARLVAADGTVSEMPVQTTAGPSADTVEILSGVRSGDVLTPAGAP